MRSIRLSIGVLLLAIAATQPNLSVAQEGWDPIAGVSKMIDWFSKLNEQVDKIIEVEKRGQLIRAVDRVRKDLYALEAEAVILRDSVPESRPTTENREYLQQLSTNLLQVVRRLSVSVRDVGAELRLNNAAEIESALTYGLRTRGLILTEFQYALAESAEGKWNPSEVRGRLDVGIKAVKAAQLAATTFRRNLDAKK